MSLKDFIKNIKQSKQHTKGYGCEYCDSANALTVGKTNDQGIAIKYPNQLIAYGYDAHGPGSNGLSVKIKYCPMCGRELPKTN